MKLAMLITCFASAACADVVVATRALRPNSILMADDLVLKSGSIPGAANELAQVIGKETRIAIYPGRPVLTGDLRAPAVIERNQIVLMTFSRNGLTIQSEGRSLSRASPGEHVRVMNISSRSMLSGTVQPDGTILVN